MGIEKEQLFSDTILIQAKNLKNNIDNYINYYLKNKFEGKCYNNSYIIKDSINIVNRSFGRLSTINNEGYIKYEVTYKVNSITPGINEKYDCKISSITKMGVVGYLDYGDNSNIEDSPLLFIIPKTYFEDENTSSLKVGDILRVELLDIRTKFMKKQIQVIGKPV
tara:strand:+ start:296 stop:790 length:495 start_codon:yes stop_codon:yes gene_type:complete